MASITKHKTGWRAFVFVHGIRATKVLETRREAQAWAATKERELDKLKASKGITFGQAATKYLTTHTSQKAASAQEWESHRLAEMAEFFGADTMLAQIDSAMIGEWRDHRLKTVSSSTVLRARNLLGNVFTVAQKEWKIIQANPVAGVRFPEHNPPRHQVWTWQLIKRVLRAEREGKALEAIHAFHVALHTAMRLNEILSAKVVGKIALLERDKSSGKQSAPVKVPLARKGAVLLAKYQPFTLKANEASAVFSDLCKELLIDGLTFHDSRATALTLLSRRFDVLTLSRISRHKNLKILLDTYFRESVEQIAARL